MAATTRISSQCAKNIAAISGWYQERSLNRGNEFIDEVIFFLKKIASNPEQYGIVTSNYRKCRMKIFPYYIIYSYNSLSHRILVYKIIHVKRNPEKRFL